MELFAQTVAGTDRRTFALSTSTGCMENSVVHTPGDDRTARFRTEMVESGDDSMIL